MLGCLECVELTLEAGLDHVELRNNDLNRNKSKSSAKCEKRKTEVDIQTNSSSIRVS